MTKEEKAVLVACDKRFDVEVARQGSERQVLSGLGPHLGPEAVELIRAIGRWRKARRKAKRGRTAD